MASRRWVIGGWLLTAALIVPEGCRLEERLEVSARVSGSESAEVEEALRTRFSSPFAHSALLVLTGVPSPEMPRGREALKETVNALRSTPGIRRTFSHLDTRDPFFIPSSGNGTFVVVGLDPGLSTLDRLVPELRGATAPLQARLRREHPSATLRWTGPAALNYDLRRTSAEEVRRAERRALPLTLALLVLAFGSLAAASLPLVSGTLATALSLGVLALVASRWPLATSVQGIVSMLGLGLGIDYALLMVNRYREARARGLDPAAAAEETARHAGRAVAVSGAAVIVGFVGLLLVPLNELRSMAVGGMLVVTASILVATTLLPALLPGLDRGRAAFPVRSAGGAWRRWSHWVVAHPVPVLILSAAPMLALALQARRVELQLPQGGWLPARMESAAALADLEAMGRAGVGQSVRILLDLPEETSALSLEGWAASRRLARALEADPRIACVRSLAAVAGDRANDLAFVSVIPAPIKRIFLSEEGDAVLVEAIPREGVATQDLTRLVWEWRRADVEAVTGLRSARLRVGGLPAQSADYQEAVTLPLFRVATLIVCTTFLVLLVAFRSLLIALKAVVLNLLSVAAAFGAAVLVFQDGHGASWLGVAGPTGGIFPALPILVLSIVFGLSMDYEVFLISRVAEARERGAGEAEALVEGLVRAGRTITSAAAIMVAVFAAFVGGDFLLVKMLGFTLAVAVILDASVVRVALGPALLRLAGRWNWWPGHPQRESGQRMRPVTRSIFGARS